MARSTSRPSGTRARRVAIIGLVLALLSPLTVFVAVVGLKTGLWSIETAYDALTIKAALPLAGLGVGGALLAVVAGAMTFRRSWLIALAAVIVSTATVSLFVRELTAANPDQSYGAGVSTDAVEPLGFSPGVMAERQADNADALASGVGGDGDGDGCAITAVPTQVAPGVAGYALQESGFAIRDLGVNRANGVHVSPWFDRHYDAAIRIRGGRTDVRVAPRDGAHDRGASCRLAAEILRNLQPRR